MIVTLTPAFIATQLIVPAGLKKKEFRDSVVRGLLIEARSTPNSVPTWCLRQKVAGKNYFDYLGTIRELTVTQARKVATQKKGERLASAKQAPEQKPTVGNITLDGFWTSHFWPQCNLHLRSAQRSEQLYRLWLKEKFGDIKLADLSRSQFLQYQAELATTHLSPASQDHVIKLARRLLNYAVELELLERNVLKGIKLRLVNNELHDVADAEGLQRYIEVLRNDSNRPVCNVLMFALSTGARLGEILKLTDDQLNLEQGLWTIPAANAKSKKSRTVPLNESAMYVLAEAMKLKKTGYVFANPATGKPYTTITRVRHRLQKLAGVKMRAHTLRHQFADSVLANGGSLYSVQMLLGHSDPRVSQRYARLSMDAQREAANGASVIVPRVTPEPTPEAKDATATPAETPTAAILPFSRAA